MTLAFSTWSKTENECFTNRTCHDPHVLFIVIDHIQVGNNITGDVRKLHKDFPNLDGEVANFCELTSLTSRSRVKCSLGELVARTSGKEMDKDLGEGAG